MSLLQKLAGRRPPLRAARCIIDRNPINWLWITYNTVEAPIRVTKQGNVRPAAMSRYRWRDEPTLDITVRDGDRFADGTPLTAESVRRSIDEQIRWHSPHPPGTHLNTDQRTRAPARR